MGFLFLLMLISCNSDKKQDWNKTIDNFLKENNVDQRETIFQVEAVEQSGKIILSGETSDEKLKNKLLSVLNIPDLIDEIHVLPDSTVGNKNFGLVNLSVANFRSKPDHAAELVTQALLGTPVKVLKKISDWYLVQTPDHYISWVDADGITPISTIQIMNWRNARRIIYLNEEGTVYESEKMKIPVSDVTMGNILEAISRDKKMIQVKFPDGRIGFTRISGWIDFDRFKNEVAPDTAKIRQLAVKLLGRPYLWGGTSIGAMDCSGFVKTVYFMNGVILARDASLQANYGQLIDIQNGFQNVHTGDLLFFGKPDKIAHVALSLNGTEFIHASGRVKRNSFDLNSEIYSEYRKNSLVKARRIIDAENQARIIPIKDHPWY